MNNFVKVKSEVSLVRDMESNAIINQNKSEFDKFVQLSETKYKEKQSLEQVKTDLDSLKTEMEEIKTLLKQMVSK
jgi:multidrug resistance efflux pump